jgi:hypothetical protein
MAETEGWAPYLQALCLDPVPDRFLGDDAREQVRRALVRRAGLVERLAGLRLAAQRTR